MEPAPGARTTPRGPRVPLPGPLHGREREQELIGGLLADARAGRGGAVLIAADPGMGRSAMLAESARIADGFTVHTIGGTAAEAHVPLAGVQRLLLPMASHLRSLPASQAATLEEVLAGNTPRGGDLRLGVCLLRLLASAARTGPQLWCVDDAQSLDATSLRALAFVARRLDGVAAAAVFATDAAGPAEETLGGITVLRLGPLKPREAGRMLAERGCGPPGTHPADEIIALAQGAPLALLELARATDQPASAPWSGANGAGLPRGPLTLPATSRLRAHYRRRYGGLSAAARAVVSLVLVGGPLTLGVVQAATHRSGPFQKALDEALAAHLVVCGDGLVTLPGPLLRAVLSGEVPLADQRAAHQALADLAERSDPADCPLRRAVHRLATADVPGPELVTDLDTATAAARAAGDHAGSASVLEQGADLTAHPQVRARWLVTAASDRLTAGEVRRSLGLLHRVPARYGPPATRGLRKLVQGEIELRNAVPARACRDLSQAVSLLSPERHLSSRALMLAGEASCLAGDFAAYFTLAEQARRLRRADDPPELQLIFDHFAGMSATFHGRHDEASHALGRVLRLSGTVAGPEPAIWASQAAYTLGNTQRAHTLAVAAVQEAGETGAHALVPAALVYQALSALMLDRHAAAETAALEGLRLAESTGQRNLAVDHLSLLALLAALQGDRATASLRLGTTAHEVAARELGRPSAFNCWASACLDLVEDHPADALARFSHMSAGVGQINLAIRAMAAPHFVEAAIRCGRRDMAARALRAFDSWAASSAGPGRRALAHRCHGLLAENPSLAEDHFREALRLHHDDHAALEMAKTQLFYASRLRRARKPRAARGLLRDALAIFQQCQARPWAERATAELRAAGDRAGTSVRHEGQDLTAQQVRICELVAQGATNREIADRLVLSSRTVEYHLRNVFARLSVRSRTELAALFR
ncbi:helix-turn-helix transcriptional regulator [Streptomyces sp. H39-S7]|uniref:helix-turn-helix transcriptional regulator n=1 Tax=Streptomyces sp. H39-S7 TaxID=3004357 RepID=UPI0022AFF5EF|nr:LuxR family transcriptional regulator [Streptomyces sp. H39-S7]MCZ4119993.1 LuxR C-terminal-related transcriptional regulator [Streptomyces sp. H39-S7]